MDGERLTSQELAERLGVSDRALKAWRAEGMPYLARGGQHAHLHVWSDVVDWLKETGREGFVPPARADA